MRINSNPREVGKLYKLVYEKMGGRENVTWEENEIDPSKKKIHSSVLLAQAKILPLPQNFNSDISKNLLSLKRPSQTRDCRFWALTLEESNLITNISKNDSVLKFVFTLEFRRWSSSWKVTMEQDEVINQVKSIFLDGKLDLTEDRILFHCQVGTEDDEDIGWASIIRLRPPLGPISVLLRFPNPVAASAAKTLVFEKVKHLIKILNQKKNILYKIIGDNMVGYDSSEFKLVDTTFPGGLIHDLIDPSRVACNPEVDHWVPAMVRTRTVNPATATVPTEISGTSSANNISRQLEEVFLKSMAPMFSWVQEVVRSFTPTTITNPTIPIEFFSEIGGLPPTSNNLPLYSQLEVVLNAMSPMFSDIGINLTNNISKVLVKAQVYEFHGGEEYQGQLHREGLDQESIAAVGLYYPLVDPGVEGGDLLLSSVIRGRCGGRFPAYESIRIRPGTAVVFDNNLCYHQLLKTYGEGLRLVVGFFVVDPKCPLPASDIVEVNMETKVDCILRNMEGKVRIWLPEPVRQIIISFVVGDLDMRFDAFRRRRLEPTTMGKLTTVMCD